MADEQSSLAEFVVYYDDWTGYEPVTLINTVPPANVTNLTATNVQSTAVTLTWTASASQNVAGYDVFHGALLVGQTSNTTLTITGLTPGTNYSFTVITRANDGLTSSGAVVSVTTPITRYALAMNGIGDYVVTPVFTFDTILMDITATPKTGGFSAYAHAGNYIADSLVGRDSAGRDFIQPAWKLIMVDGVDYTSRQGTTAFVPFNQRTTLKVVLKAPAKAAVNIFSNQLGSIAMKGILYKVQFMLGAAVVADYDFTVPFTGNVVPDASGNNRAANLKGGTWISW